MPRPSDLFNEPLETRVLLRNERGKYLAADAHGLFFTEDRSAALVLNYRADRVEQQLEAIRTTLNINLVTEPIPPEQVYENCDRCGDLFMPFMVFFDGKSFLCADCRRRAAALRRSQPHQATSPSTSQETG